MPVTELLVRAGSFCLVSPGIAGYLLSIGMPRFVENASKLVTLRPCELFPLGVDFALVTICHDSMDLDS